MKKKLFLRLCLILAVGFSAFSCRTEEFHNEEEAHGNTQFHLTSKRISLNESKHKAKLLPELQKAEVGIKAFAQKNAKGKINYADGVTIDTDQVTYIENGPNFHTYTFHLTRQNALPTDPIENLVLIPATDGSYREMLISYNLTSQEKQLLMEGEYVDTKDKTSIILLDGAVYNPLGTKSNQSCVWVPTIVGYTACSANEHFNGEGGNVCGAKIKSQPITDYFLKCTSIAEAPLENNWWAGPGGGSSGGGGGGVEPCTDCPTNYPTPEQPCDGNGVATAPVDPNTYIGIAGECEGIPTVIEFNPPANPCEKTKALLADLVVKNKIDSLEAQSVKLGTDKGEKAFLYMNDNTTSALITGEDHKVNLSLYSGYKGVYHNHTPYGTKMLAPYDILTLYKTVVYQQSSATAKDAFVGLVVHETCNCPPDNFVYHNYLLRFNGDFSETGAIATLSKEEMKKIEDKYWALESELLGIPSLRNGSGLSASLNPQGLEQLFFGILAKMNIVPNQITLQKIEKGGTINTIQLNPDGTTTPVPCP